MSSSSYGFLYNPSLPSEEKIVAHCSQLNVDVRGTTIVDPSTTSVIAWIKWGPLVTIDEARTQDWTAQALRSDVSDVQAPRVFHAFTVTRPSCQFGYIAMEYIEGIDCDSKDVELVAKAVQRLISLQAPPDATLGHLGGGAKSIVHSFFPEWLPNAIYDSDQDFYAHIHNILKLWRPDFHGDISSHGRFLCPSDFNSGNFRKRTMEDGRLVVVVLDFHATCFMSPPFIEVALRKAEERFCQLVVKKIKYPHENSAHAADLLSASRNLIPYGLRPIALPPGVESACRGVKSA